MKTICILLLSLISCSCEAFIQETGPPGGSVRIKCPYNGWYEGGHKYFCKFAKDGGCDILVSDEEQRQLTSQRLNLTYHKRDKYFMVTMTNLTGEDTGVYWCVADEQPPFDSEVHIQVNPVFGEEGDKATFRCPYEKGYQGNKKLFSRGECSIWNKDILIISEESQIQARTGRFSLYDNIDARVFSVTMRGLTAKDSGKYVCAVRTIVADVCTDHELVVRDAARKPTLTPNQMTSLPPVTGSWPHRSPIILTVSLTVVMVVIIGAVVFMIYRNRRNNIPVPAVSLPQMTPRDNTQNDVDYENDTARGAAVPTTTQQGPVYQSLNPDTTQQDPVYQSLNPNTTQQDPVYQSLNPNSIQQDPVYQSLNPNTIQQDTVYQSLNPNTIQQDPVYQSLNPNTIQ